MRGYQESGTVNADGTFTQNVAITGSLANDALVPTGSSIAQTPVLFNETSWDRQRGNTEGTLLASAARTVLSASAIQKNHNGRGVQVTLDVSAASGTGGLQLVIQNIDPATTYAFTLTPTPTAVTVAGTYIYELYPGIGASASGLVVQRTSGLLPRSWRIAVLHGDASSYTYSVGYSLIL